MLQTNDIESHCEKKSSNLSIYFTQVLENNFQYTKKWHQTASTGPLNFILKYYLISIILEKMI